MFAAQLAAGGIDVGAVFLADDAVDVVLFEDIIERQNILFGAALVFDVFGNRIVRDQVHVGKVTLILQQGNQFVRLLRSVVHARDHDVFESDAAVCLFQILVDGGHDFLQRVFAVDAHHAAADFIVRRVQGQSQVDLQPVFREFADLRSQSAGGNRDVASADCQTFGVVDDVQEGDDIVVIVERFADAHHDDVADAFTIAFLIQVVLDLHDLCNDFACCQVALFAFQAACAERAADIAADLRRDADGQAVFLTHQDGFDHQFVFQLEEIFSCAVR